MSCLHNPDKWHNWLQDSSENRGKVLNNESFTYSDCNYNVMQPLANGADFSVENKELKLNTRLEALSLNPDSTLVTWKGGFIASNNPFKRINQYIQAINIRHNIQDVLDHLAEFASKPINVYGFNIERTSFNDTLLIASKQVITNPDLNTIYSIINGLKSYIAIQKGAKETDFPMLHLKQLDSSHYNIMVAIAIDKAIPESGNYFIVRMPHMDGKFVKADVRGGPATIDNAHKQIGAFMNDHLLTSPGIPFEILVTDRFKETDTSKWVTKVYHPST